MLCAHGKVRCTVSFKINISLDGALFLEFYGTILSMLKNITIMQCYNANRSLKVASSCTATATKPSVISLTMNLSSVGGINML